MVNHKKSAISFLKNFLLIITIYTAFRALFYFMNIELFGTFSFKTFIGGLLFDLSAVAYLNTFFIIAYLFPGNFKYKPKYQKTLKIAFYTVNLIFIGTNFIDLIYFRFTGRRSTYNMITAKGMEHEAIGLIPTFLLEFWYITFIFLVLSILLWFLISAPSNDISVQKLTKKDYYKQSAYLVISIVIILIIGRGGLQEKPIKIVDAIQYGALQNTGLVLNTPFTILKTITSKDDIEVTNYFNKKELLNIYNSKISIEPNQAPIKKNVVILILESYGNENIGRGQTPFIDSLITKSHYFKNAFANGKVSIDAVPSVLSSIPSLMNNSFITSSYSLNKVDGLPTIFKNQGYNTSFFHGAFNGSQNFDKYTKVTGFDQYFGKDEYTGKESFDGKWGVFDEEFLQFFASKVKTFKQPFFTTLFTISSHTPYTIPERYKGKFPKGTTEIHESVAYTDYALRKFFDTAKKQDWYKNTLFVFTADHTSAGGDKDIDKTNMGKFRIPIFFYDPSNPGFAGVDEKIFQQTDIMPSVLDYLNIKSDMISFGKSYKSKENFAVYYLQGTYHLVQDDYYLAFANNQTIGLYNWKKDVLLKRNLMNTDKLQAKKMETFLKAYIQTFDEKIINNQLTL